MRNLSLLLDFDEQYRRDQQHDGDFLHRRDRHLAVAQGVDGGHGSLAAWLSAVRGQARDPEHADEPLRAWRWMRVLFVVAGIVLGAATMLGLLYYDGGRRINVSLIMAVAVLQLLLALVTTVEAWIGWQPWHGLFRDVVVRWWPAAAQPQPMLRALAAPLAARVAQSGGLAFALAAFVVLLSLVVVKDLAFGWSTTLQTSAPAYHALTSALAWPWHGWLPGAVPSLPLVEQSRFFRAGTPMMTHPELLGIWWRFLAMLWLCYVVVPRIVLLALARVQLAARARRVLATHPGRAALCERCTTPWIDNGGGVGSGTLPIGGNDKAVSLPATPGQVLIRWADAGDASLARTWLGVDAVSLDAGGSASLDADSDALEQTRVIGGPVIILARGWAPPTGELADFLGRVCEQRDRAPIQLIPLAVSSVPTRVDGPALAPWRRFVERLRQPMVVVADVPVTGKHRHE